MKVGAVSSVPEAELEIARHLVAKGLLDAPSLDRAVRIARSTQEPLHLGLVKLGLIGERDLAEALAERLGLPLLQRQDYPVSPLALEKVSVVFLQRSRVVPVRRLGATELLVAAADPLDRFVGPALAAATGLTVRLGVGVPADIEAALDRLYGESTDSVGEVAAGEEAPTRLDDDLDRLRDLASEAPVIRLVGLLIARAVEQRASDIHFETFRSRLRVRYRIDGELREVESPPAQLRAAVVSRIKIMAQLDIAERRLPQDGRIKLAVRGRDIDLRVSILPTMHGESVVLRILDREGLTLDFETLGFGTQPLERWRSALLRPNGVILTTGPTGSGKTSTLYASMKALDATSRKIVTVEDPIEYEMEGINQIQARHQIGLGFAHILRSILRHDPDIVMIGEIRDGETAEMAVQAALTGHLVLSTLHTNDAASAVTRLTDMGIEEYLLTSTVNAVAAQRLVRRLCPSCREAYVPLPQLVAQLGIGAALERSDGRLFRARGCAHCANTGYLGRVALVEVMTMSDALRRLVLERAEAGALLRTAVEEGMRTMFDDGVAKALAGTTSLDEVIRVTRTS